jgi:hypothetical protein
MKLGKDGKYTTDMKVVVNGRPANRLVSKGTYKVGASTLLFRSDRDEEVVYSYTYYSNGAREYFAVTIKTPMQSYRLSFQRVPE